MFGLFKNKKYKPTVFPEDKEWIENNINTFIQWFGIERLKKQPFILPTQENFPYDNLNDNSQFQKLFEQLCDSYELNPDDILVKIFDDLKSKQWSTWVINENSNEPVGYFYQSYSSEEKRFTIQIAKSNFNDSTQLVTVLSHELAHVKVIGDDFIRSDDPNLEPLTDLVNIFFGFGIFIANSCQKMDTDSISRIGYLPNEIISYTIALISYITQHNINNYLEYFNLNIKELVQKDFDFLLNTNDTILSKDVVSESNTQYLFWKKTGESFENRNFDEVIQISKKQLLINPKNAFAFNTLGCALSKQKNYAEAIYNLTSAIDIVPLYDYAYNNRGYCKLQLGYMEDAFADIQSALEMNPDNAYAWRNLGAYYLQVDELDKALEHFESAQKIDNKTELINFYLGHNYFKLGDLEKAKIFFEKSKELDEYNDTIIWEYIDIE